MSALPRLALVSEVPPLNLSAGPAVLYRLLLPYPPELLLLCDDAGLPRYPGAELENVARVRLHFNWTRLMNSRLGRWHAPLALLFGPELLARRIASILRRHSAEAVATVAHGHVWWPAWLAAQRLGLPLHLIMHDHWRDCLELPPWLEAEAQRRFAVVYRGAATRLAISPAMARRYSSLYGAEAVVLPPGRHPSAVVHTTAPARRSGPFVFAYAGGMGGAWARQAVVDLAHACAPHGARVRVYQTISIDVLRVHGLRTDNVEIQPFLPALELHRHLREQADAMFLPMSFDPRERSNMELCFPSKLADYTLPALPLLVYAPPYGTAVEWLKANPAAGLVVDRRDPLLLSAAVARLSGNPTLCARLGEAAAIAGARDFSSRVIFDRFAAALEAPLVAA